MHQNSITKSPDIEVIGEASSGEEAIEFTRNTSPKMILMDMKMPGIGGLEATRHILQRQPHIKIIAVTSCEEEPFHLGLKTLADMAF